MKLIKPTYDILPLVYSKEDILRQIELVGRTCYKSEDIINECSSKEFVERMISSEHFTMLEHGTVYLTLSNTAPITGYKYRDNKYSTYIEIREQEKPIPIITKYITTNYRVLIENNWLDDLQYLSAYTIHHLPRVSVKIVCNKEISHELVSHKVFSSHDNLQESIGYCNYTKDKFNNQLTFIIPSWMDNIEEGEYNTLDVFNTNKDVDCNQINWFNQCLNSENTYNTLIKEGWTAQQARSVLPNSLKTEIVMTGFLKDWLYFFKLISLGVIGNSHPDMERIVTPLMEDFNRLFPKSLF